MFSLPERIGSYDILAHLRSGGMAVLLLGRRQGPAGFSRPVAIKVVHPHLVNDESFLRMFVDEALLSSRIQHPNVVHVEELGQDASTYFLVMEYVHGCALSQLLRTLAVRGTAFRPEIAVYIACEVAAGLHAAHNATGPDGETLDLVHRDVSPQNVLISAGGQIKVIDFGVAKARGRAQQTTGLSLKGKLRYMAPEQARGRSLDQRTDVYALGIVLWEMLTLRRLFDGSDEFETLRLVQSPTVSPPSAHAPEVSPELDAAVLKALSVDPAGRPESAYAFRRELIAAVPAVRDIDATVLVEELAPVMEPIVAALVAQLPESARSMLTGRSDGEVSVEIALEPAPVETDRQRRANVQTISQPHTAAGRRKRRRNRFIALGGGAAGIGLGIVLFGGPFAGTNDTVQMDPAPAAAPVPVVEAEPDGGTQEPLEAATVPAAASVDAAAVARDAGVAAERQAAEERERRRRRRARRSAARDAATAMAFGVPIVTDFDY